MCVCILAIFQVPLFAILKWLFLFIALFRVVLSRTRYTPSTTTTTTAMPAIYILLLVSARKNIFVYLVFITGSQIMKAGCKYTAEVVLMPRDVRSSIRLF